MNIKGIRFLAASWWAKGVSSIFELFDWLGRTFASLFFFLVQLVCFVVFFIEQAFWSLARGIKINGSIGYRTIIDLLLYGDLNSSTLKAESAITKMIIFMSIIGIAFTILALVLALFKKQFSTRDEDNSPKQAVLGVIKALVLIVAFPFIVSVMLKISNALVDTICTYAGISTGDPRLSIANQFFMSFGEARPEFFASEEIDGIIYNHVPQFSFMTTEKELLEFINANPSIVDEGRYGEQRKYFVKDGTDISMFNSLYVIGFFKSLSVDAYQYIAAIFCMLILAYGLIKCILILGRRIFDIGILFVVAPIAISTYPLDEGKRYNVWKELILSKILSTVGITLGFIVYAIFMQEIRKIFSGDDLYGSQYFEQIARALDVYVNQTGDAQKEAIQGLINNIIYIVINISGALAIPTSYTLISSLISETAGHQASQEMSNINSDIGNIQRTAHFMAGAGALIGKTLVNKSGAGNLLQGVAGVASQGAGGAKGGVIQNRFQRALGTAGSIASGFKQGGLIGGALSLGANLAGSAINKVNSLKANSLRDAAIKNYGTELGKQKAATLEKRYGIKLDQQDVINARQAEQTAKSFGVDLNDNKFSTSKEEKKQYFKQEKNDEKALRDAKKGKDRPTFKVKK